MRCLLIAGALALAACSAAESESRQTASVRGCQAVATDHWRPLSGVEFTVEAFSNGPDCEHAVATIVVRDLQNSVLWADAAPTQNLFGLNEARDAPAMQAALSEWIATDNQPFASSAALPAWPANAESPESGEFPFYVEPEWADRERYESLRAEGVPIYCYVQGMESLSCVALQNGSMHKVGVQSFPG